ncbi:MAG: diguanylate cyclase [Pseudomonadota bacterium]
MSTCLTLEQALDCYRKTDAVFIVCQNNKEKKLEIVALNDEARSITGYSNEEVIGKAFSTILPESINTLIDDYIVYESDKKEDSNDLLTVLSKIRKIIIKKRDGSELEFKLRVIAGELMENNPLFHILLVDEKRDSDASAFRLIIKENFKGHEVIDPSTNLPDRASIMKDIELIIYYVRDKNIAASFAIIDINYYDQTKADYGVKICQEIHKHVSNIFRQKLRPEDTIGMLSERSLGVIMVGASQEEARIVLNRLRWAISVTALQLEKEELFASVNVCFTQIDGKTSNTELLDKCEKFTEEYRHKSHNSINLVVASERREEKSHERRKQNIPVELDRRRKDRRKDR